MVRKEGEGTQGERKMREEGKRVKEGRKGDGEGEE